MKTLQVIYNPEYGVRVYEKPVGLHSEERKFVFADLELSQRKGCLSINVIFRFPYAATILNGHYIRNIIRISHIENVLRNFSESHIELFDSYGDKDSKSFFVEGWDDDVELIRRIFAWVISCC